MLRGAESGRYCVQLAAGTPADAMLQKHGIVIQLRVDLTSVPAMQKENPEFKLKGLYKIRKGNLLSRGAAIAMQEDMALQEEAENPAIGHGGAGEWRDG